MSLYGGDLFGPKRGPEIHPVWACTGYLKEPRKSWSKARRKANLAGTLYVRAPTADRARAWAKGKHNPLPGWRKCRYVLVHQASATELGMVPVTWKKEAA